MKNPVVLQCKDPQLMERLGTYFLLMRDDRIEITTKAKHPNAPVIRLDDQNGDIDMYQKASDIYNQLYEIILKKYPNENKPMRTQQNEMISVVGDGIRDKASFIHSLCKKNKQKDHQVLYLNPDSYCTCVSPFQSNNDKDFSQLYYHIEQKKDVAMAIESMVSLDMDNHIYYINNTYCTPDIYLSKQDMSYLIHALKQDCCYDVVIFDIPCMITMGQIELMKHSDKVYLLEDKGNKSMDKIFKEYDIQNMERIDHEKVNEGNQKRSI